MYWPQITQSTWWTTGQSGCISQIKLLLPTKYESLLKRLVFIIKQWKHSYIYLQHWKCVIQVLSGRVFFRYLNILILISVWFNMINWRHCVDKITKIETDISLEYERDISLQPACPSLPSAILLMKMCNPFQVIQTIPLRWLIICHNSCWKLLHCVQLEYPNFSEHLINRPIELTKNTKILHYDKRDCVDTLSDKDEYSLFKNRKLL